MNSSLFVKPLEQHMVFVGCALRTTIAATVRGAHPTTLLFLSCDNPLGVVVPSRVGHEAREAL
jgi:hypothetical protein